MTVAQTSMRLQQSGEALASALPPLLVRAEKIAASVILGVHGRKTAGTGESFWQYRPSSFGDSTARVDWHRSAKGDKVYIRENEWESANTLWVWANASPRMRYQSHLASTSKMERAQLLAIAAASLAVRGHERVGVLGSPHRAGHGRMALQRLAEWVAQPKPENLPEVQALQKRAAALLISDFLDPIDGLRLSLTRLAATGIQGHLVQINDPAEESLPFDGRIEFQGLDMPASYLARKTEDLRVDYAKAFLNHRNGVRDLARSLGWTFIVHRTDQTPTQCLLPLHLRVSGALNAARVAMASAVR